MNQNSQNISTMQLRSHARKQLTHSGRDFVINHGYIEQKPAQSLSAPPRSTALLIDISASLPLEQNQEKPKNISFNVRRFVLVLVGVLTFLQIMCFLAWKFGQSLGNDL